ncbi:hypothetical protein AS149_37055 [Burkholderia cenocepacia]|nr:hypothetical protein AS149_37055 [Burkholderia cenocepacia]
MRHPWTLSQAALEMGVDIDASELQRLEADLLDELQSIVLYPETRTVLLALKDAGYQVAVCSNLALPYAAPVEALVGDLLDVRVWSFDAGATKPSPAIYQALLARGGTRAQETLMVGDSLAADYEGARAAGLHALHLVRDSAAVADGKVASLTEVVSSLDRTRKE